MKRYIIFPYHVADNNFFETCLNSLRKTGYIGDIIVITCDFPLDLQKEFSSLYKVKWVNIPSLQVVDRLALSKLEYVERICSLLVPGDQVIVSDVDVYFLSNPFQVFNEANFDLGLTIAPRIQEANEGFYCLRVSNNIKWFLRWAVSQIIFPSWGHFKRRLEYYNLRLGKKWDLNWGTGRAFFQSVWSHNDYIKDHFSLNVIDVGCKYCFWEEWGEYAKSQSIPLPQARKVAWSKMLEAFNNKLPVIFHFCGSLKEYFYSVSKGSFEHAIIRFPIPSNMDWQSNSVHPWYNLARRV